MAQCKKCQSKLDQEGKCWTCAKSGGTATVVATTAAPTAQLPADWNNVSYSIKEQPEIRSAFASALGILDKGHKTHGSNFTSPQTKKQIMDNLLEPCRNSWPTTKWKEMCQKCIITFGYNPDA